MIRSLPAGESYGNSPLNALHIETLRFLATSEGRSLLAETERLPDDRLLRISRLRKMVSSERAAIAVELLELRERARGKFSLAEAMFFTKEGLEQSTSEIAAAYRASRFTQGGRVFDACAGIGGDCLALLQANEVIAVDTNLATLTCLRLNAEVLHLQRASALYTLCADVSRLDLARLRNAGFSAAFVDPSRRRDDEFGGRRRARSGAEYSPPLEWVRTLRASIPSVGVKISPAVDEATLYDCPDAEVEFVSVRGECREAVLWFGGLAIEGRRPLEQFGRRCYAATLLGRGDKPFIFAPFECDSAPLVSPRAWLYEPDPAVIRAHLVPQLASQLNAGIFAPDIAYLTSDSLVETPFATAYRVLESMPYRPKEVAKWLRKEGRRVEAVKKRGVPLEPEAVRKSLSVGEGSPLTLVLTPHNGGTLAVLCERIG